MSESELYIHVIDPTGKKHTLPALEGWRVMEIIRDYDVPIRAECGGSCACATCHVYVDHRWFNRLQKPDSEETYMLDQLGTFNPETSRLSCQILMSKELDGLTVTLAPETAES
jgi:2Fe-2S ferredoxin